MPTNLHIVRRILELYGPQTTKQIFVHYPEAGSVNQLKNTVLRQLEADNNIWKVNMAVDGVAKHVWMTREQKLAFQKERRTGKAAPEAAETTATA